jgi:hypothetical protein
MDERYVKDCTRNWEPEGEINGLCLYSFFDTVDWRKRYAIKQGSEVLYAFEFDEFDYGSDYYNVLKAVAEVVSKIKPCKI